LVGVLERIGTVWLEKGDRADMVGLELRPVLFGWRKELGSVWFDWRKEGPHGLVG
jgi:hypothetical protein